MRFAKCIVLVWVLTLTALATTMAAAQQAVPYSVSQIQKALNEAGYNAGTPDGIWGKRSAKALKQFQQDRGIEITGKMDPVTMRKLFPIQESLRKHLEAKPVGGDEGGQTVVVTPVEKRALPPTVSPVDGLNQSNLELVTMLRLAEYGVGPCNTKIIDASKVSQKLFDALGAEKFTELENELRTKGSEIARGYPTRGTDYPSNTCVQWEKMAKSRSVDKPAPEVEYTPSQPKVESEKTPPIAVTPVAPAPTSSNGPNIEALLVIGGLVLVIVLLLRGRKKGSKPVVPEPTPIHPATDAFPLNIRRDVIRTAPTLHEPEVALASPPSAVAAMRPAPTQTPTPTPTPTPKTEGFGTTRWVKRGQSVSYDGRTIDGGFFYFGTSLKCVNNAWANENCLIDPTKEVAKGRPDVSGQYMPYWPSYSDIPPSSRKAYLDWLSGPRSDVNTYIGYVFLYFYGLERRLMLDGAADDTDTIVAEVRRLLDVYSFNGSFRRYAAALLDAHALRRNGFKEDDAFDFDVDGGELPLNLRMALGIRVRDERPVEHDLLLAFTIGHPETRPRTPARRAFPLLKELFAEQVKTRYPNGFFLKSRKKLADLTMNYRAASNTFEVSVMPGGLRVPDVLELETPLALARALLEECTDKLDAYSRELGKSDGLKPTIAAVAKLPPELRLTEAARLAPNPVDVLHRYAESGQSVSIDLLSKQIGNGALGDPNRAKLMQLSALLAAFGFGWTADPTFTLKNGKLESTAVVFRLENLRSAPETASDPYLHTRMLLQIGMIVANADGVVDEAERAKLDAIVQGANGVSMDERRRLRADLAGLDRDPGSVADWTKRLKDAPVEKRRELGVHVAHIAQADGIIGRDEVVQLEKLFKIMGIDQQVLYQHLHGSSVIQPANDDLPITIIPAGRLDLGSEIPTAPAPSKKTSIDLEKLAGIRSETQNTASILGDIFRDEQEPDHAAPPAEEMPPSVETSDGLDGRHRAFLRELLTRPEWQRPDFDGLAKRIGLMSSAAMEAINDWAYERFDDLLIAGEDPVYVELTLIPENEFGEAA